VAVRALVCIIPAAGNGASGRNSKEVMADDDIDEEIFDAEVLEDDIDEDALDEDVLDDELADDDVLVDDDAVVDADVDEDEVVEEPVARVRKRGEDDEDDEDEVDPDDVEADLDAILKDRIAAADEDEDEEEEEVAPRAADTPDGVIPKRANEFTCTGCFLLVNRGQFGPPGDLRCPVGESECPAIDQLQETVKPAAPTKLATKAAKATKKR